MDFSKLHAFVTVAEELNFRKSADMLGMSQPPLTRLISSLEKEVGAQLFERTTRQVRLTGAGVVLLKEARDILSALERIKTDVKEAGKVRRSALRVGFSTTAFLARLPVILEEFQSRFPKIKIDLQQAPAKEILKGIREGHFDAGFVEGITTSPGLQTTPVIEEVLGVLLPKNHPLAKRKEIDFEDLKEETIILHHKREAEEFHDRISNLIQGMKKRPRVYIKADGESCPILVAVGKGVALTIAGAQQMAPEGTRFVPLHEMFLPVSIFWKETEQDQTLQIFLSAVMENQFLRKSKTHCLNLAPSEGSTI